MSSVRAIWSKRDRDFVCQIIQTVPDGSRVEVKGPRRSTDQNALMWILLSFVAENVEWHGIKLEPEDWKIMFVAKLKKLRIVPNIDGDGFVALGASTSLLSKAEFSDLIESIYEFCASAQLELPEPPPRRLETERKTRFLEASKAPGGGYEF
jgi:hypothetical protein